MTSRRFWQWTAVAAAVGLLLRVAWVLWVAREPTGLVDPVRYLNYAREIADGRGMTEPFTGDPTAYYPPGYPWFLGIVAWLSSPFTDNIVAVATLVQAALGAATVVLGAMAGRALAGTRAGVAAAIGLALYPNLIFHTGALLGETLHNFLFLAFVVALLLRPWSAEVDGWRRALACGVLLGLAVMVRPISLAMVPVVVGYWWLMVADRRRVLRWSLVLLAGVAACILPWTVRNAVRLQAFVPISTNTGDNFCIGHADGADGSFRLRTDCDVPYPFSDGLATELKADKEKLRIGLRGMVDNADREPWLLWKRFYFTYVHSGDHDGVVAVESYRLDWWMDRGTESTLMRVGDIGYWILCVGGLVGSVAILYRRRPGQMAVLGFTIMMGAVPLAFFGDSRFKVPVIPLMILVAAVAFSGQVAPTASDDDEH